MKKEKHVQNEQTAPIEDHDKAGSMPELKVIKKEDLWRFRGGGGGSSIDF